MLPTSFCKLLTLSFSFAQREEATTASKLTSHIHQDAEGNCIFGQKSYWDSMYSGKSSDNRPASSYSWYCGWDELAPFWQMLIPNKNARILVAGIGNDITPVNMFDAGWNYMTAFDYSETGVKRATSLFGDSRKKVKLLTADARDLPLADRSIDAVLDKGTLDAIYISGKEGFIDAVRELGRVTSEGGIVLSISRVIPQDDLLDTFDSTNCWKNIHDGSLAFAPDGEATIDLGADMYSWKKKGGPNA